MRPASVRKSSLGQRTSVSTGQLRKSSLSGEESVNNPNPEPKIVGVMVKQKSEACLPPMATADIPTGKLTVSLNTLTEGLEMSQRVNQSSTSQDADEEGSSNLPGLPSPSPLHSPLVFDGDEGERVLQPCTYVGVNLIQEQLRLHAVKRGFTFNVMVVGRSGLGKTTLVNTLFQTSFVQKKHLNLFQTPPTVGLRKTSHVLEEHGVRVKLSVVDTQGYGDYVNNANCWIPLVEYIQTQNKLYLHEELQTDRARHIPDNRIHCCLYFIPPTSYGLRPLDIHVLTQLQTLVNIIPVIAKADSLLPEERVEFKQCIRQDLADNKIGYYCHNPEAGGGCPTTANLTNLIPFAVVGSENSHEIKLSDGTSRTVLGRKTSWGLVEVQNPQHCEFSQLRDTLIRTCLYDLIDTTDYKFYEKYRREQLTGQVHDKVMPNLPFVAGESRA